MLENINESVVREKIENILSNREFAKGDQKDGLTDALANWVKSMLEWLRDRLNDIRLPDMNFNVMPQAGLASGTVTVLQLIAIILLAAILVFLVVFFLKKLGRSKKLKQEEDDLLLMTLKDPDLVLETALSFSAKGDYRQGLRYLYISLILKFNERNLIKIDKAKTNRQYLQELKNNDYGRQDEVTAFTRAFNDYWYGGKSIHAGIFDFWHSKYRELRGEENV